MAENIRETKKPKCVFIFRDGITHAFPAKPFRRSPSAETLPRRILDIPLGNAGEAGRSAHESGPSRVAGLVLNTG